MMKLEFVDILKADKELQEKVRLWRNQDRIRTCMLSQHLISKEEHFKWLESLSSKDSQQFWVVFVNNEPIGAVYLQSMDHSKLSSEWGFYIGEEAYTGKGLSAGIIYKLLNHFFEVMKFEVLITKVLSGNKTALGLYKKFNFKEVDKSTSSNGREVITHNLSKDNWLEIKDLTIFDALKSS